MARKSSGRPYARRFPRLRRSARSRRIPRRRPDGRRHRRGQRQRLTSPATIAGSPHPPAPPPHSRRTLDALPPQPRRNPAAPSPHPAATPRRGRPARSLACRHAGSWWSRMGRAAARAGAGGRHDHQCVRRAERGGGARRRSGLALQRAEDGSVFADLTHLLASLHHNNKGRLTASEMGATRPWMRANAHFSRQIQSSLRSLATHLLHHFL